MYIPMSIHKITPSVNYNKRWKRFDTQLNKLLIKKQKQVLKVFEPPIRNGYYKTLGTSVINSSMSPTSSG